MKYMSSVMTLSFFVFFLLFQYLGTPQTYAAPVSIVEFNFENTTKRGNITNAATFISSPYTADSGITENIDTASIIITSGINTLSWDQGSGGAGTFSPNFTSSWASGSGAKYWTLEFSTENYENLTLSSKQRSSNTGPRDFKVQYSTDGTLWYDVSGSNITVANNFTSGVLNNLALPVSLENQENVYLRWIMTSDTSVSGGIIGAAGTSRIDDIIIQGEFIDTEAPVISLAGITPIDVELGSTYSDAGATAIDNIDGDISASIITNNPVNTSLVGTYTVTYDVSDTAGNDAIQVTRTVNVVDSTPPITPLNPPDLQSVFDTGISSTDNIANSIPVTFDVLCSESGSTISLYSDSNIAGTGACVAPGTISIATTSPPPAIPGTYDGTYSITYTETDSEGNESDPSPSLSVTVDTLTPSITFIDNVNIGPVQSDTVQVSITDSHIYQNQYAFSTNALCDSTDFPGTSYTGSILNFDDSVHNGEYICFRAEDEAGNISYTGSLQSFNIDTIFPVITRLGNAIETVQVGEVYTDAGATASDNYDGDITGNITINNPVNTTVVGSYTVTYDVSDTAGNNAVQVTRTVNVVDTEMPIISLLGTTPVDIEVGSSYTDAGATASDNYDGDITGDIVVSGDTVDTDTIGSYTISYDVQDSEGNDALQVQRVVNIVDTTLPVITLVGTTPLDVELGSTYTDGGATASDNYDGNITGDIVVGGDTIDTNAIGDYIITYNVEDSSGNHAIQISRTVRVRDTQAPLFQVNDDVNTDKNNSDTVNISITDIDLDITSIEYGFSVDDTCDINDTFGNVFSADTDFVFTHELHNGEYLCIKAADVSGNTAYFISNEAFNIDSIAPTLTEIHPVISPTVLSTPSYVFHSSEVGTITYAGGCSSSTDTATIGDNTITFNNLGNGVYSNCTLRVTDSVGNISLILPISSFTVSVPTPSSGGGGGGGGASKVDNTVGLTKDDLISTKFLEKDSQEGFISINTENTQENTEKTSVDDVFYQSQDQALSDTHGSELSQFVLKGVECEQIEKILADDGEGNIFTDVEGESELDVIIKKFGKTGVITLENDTFEGDREMTRVEYLKVLLKTYCISYEQVDGETVFYDVEYGTWGAKVIERAYELGIINGQNISGNIKIFRPLEAVTKAESLKMLLKLVGYKNPSHLSWENSYIQQAVNLGISSDDGGENDPILRKEALELIYKIITLSNKSSQ